MAPTAQPGRPLLGRARSIPGASSSAFACQGRKENQCSISPQTILHCAQDHLGSTSAVRVAESRHRPYGEVRWPADDGAFPTDYRFTGQLLDG
jgi:hypothetical protein